jgi:predicted NAD-dependent protein-ADP-ribosyltransferase YbiA (DUF1768 family)
MKLGRYIVSPTLETLLAGKKPTEAAAIERKVAMEKPITWQEVTDALISATFKTRAVASTLLS